LSAAALPLRIVRANAPRVAAWVVAVVLLAVGLRAFAQSWETGTDGLLPIPPLAARVTDLTHTLSPTEVSALETKLADWETKTTNQLVVLLVPTTQPEPIEAYTLRVAEKWQIGRKGKDNGAVFLVAKNDRKMRIEVGYGLEGVLPDVTARRIIAEDVAPKFRDGKFAEGINAGVDRIIAVVGGETQPSAPATQRAKQRTGLPFSLDNVLLLLFIVVPVVGGILRRMFGRLLGATVGAGLVGGAAWLFMGSLAIAIIAGIIGFIVMIFFGLGNVVGRRGMGGGLGSGWGGGWGGGGGGFSSGGGFSGGGGSFGGGGASGNW